MSNRCEKTSSLLTKILDQACSYLSFSYYFQVITSKVKFISLCPIFWGPNFICPPDRVSKAKVHVLSKSN